MRRKPPPVQLTLRGMGEDLERHLRHLAQVEQLSLNQAALKVLRRGAGLSERRARADSIGPALDDFIGTWSAARARKALAAAKAFEGLDEELWR
jgi:hypothetical protein